MRRGQLARKERAEKEHEKQVERCALLAQSAMRARFARRESGSRRSTLTLTLILTLTLTQP